MKFLILIVVVVGIIALTQLARVYELAKKLRDTREEEISLADNKLNAFLWIVFMIIFFVSTVFLYVRYGDYLPVSASAHGVESDWLMNLNIVIITIVFFIVNALLFIFASRYYYRKDRTAKFQVHDNKLEIAWTAAPAVVLAFIIIFGLRTWNNMTGPASADAIQIELYSKQFDWTARYPGNNGEFGLANYNLITASNPLGIATEEGVAESISLLDEDILKIEDQLNFEKGRLMAEKYAIEEALTDIRRHDAKASDQGEEAHGHDDHHGDHRSKEELMEALKKIEMKLNSPKVSVLSEAAIEAKEEKLHNLIRTKQRILAIDRFALDEAGQVQAWEAGKDDKIVKGEFHLPLGREVEFVFRSRDVIHSAYMPHFRAQMNTVPGLPTRFKMTPTITTDSMRVILDDPDFNYILLCNKVCGSAHFNMQMNVVVDTPEEYAAWLVGQKTFVSTEEETDETKGAVETDEKSETAYVSSND